MQDKATIYMALASLIVFFFFASYTYFRNRFGNDKAKAHNSMFQETFFQDDIDIQMLVDERLENGKGVSREMAIIKAVLARDKEYAWSWYCNLVLSFVDAGCKKKVAMKGASRFLNVFAHIDVTKDPRYIEEFQRLVTEDIATFEPRYADADITRPGPLL